MKKGMLFFIIGTFLLTLTVIRMFWYSNYTNPHPPEATKGILDLGDWELSDNKLITLNGEWEFFPNILLTPEEIHTVEKPSTRSYITIPENPKSISKGSNSVIGTYRLRILLVPKDSLQSYKIRISNIQLASRLFVNGELVGSSGQLSNHKGGLIAENIPYSTTFNTNKNEIILLIQVAKGDYPNKGGIVEPIKFGYASALNRATSFSVGTQLLVCTVFFTLAIYSGFLYFIGGRPKVLLYFILVTISAILTILVSDDKILFSFLPLNYESSIKLIFLSYSGVSLSMFLFFKHLLPEYAKSRLFHWFPIFCCIYMLFILFSPVKSILLLSFLLSFILLIPSVMITGQLIKATIDGYQDVMYLLFGAIAITNNIIWAVVKNHFSLNVGFYPIDFLFTLFFFSAFWLKRYFQNAMRTEQLSKELIKADKRKDQFLMNTSHELRNPLHGIINIAQTIIDSEKNKLSENSSKDLELLITIGKRMSLMINDLIDFTRLKENKIRLQSKNLHIQSIVSGVLDMLQFLIAGKPIKLTQSIPDTFPNVFADENRVIQILLNLIHNAIKFTDKGHITITATIEDNEALIHITDTGIGIEKNMLQGIFRPYEQGEPNSNNMRGGIGLGLSICKQLVELHGGKLTVHSVVDQGTVFTFSLPLAEQQEYFTLENSPVDHNIGIEIPSVSFSSTLVSESNESTLFSDHPKLLIVDDEPVNLHILTNILSTEGYEIETAISGEEVLAKLDDEQWDLIISDVMMPNMSGYELSTIIRKSHSISELPILLLTARSQPEDLAAGFKSGANDYIVKPVDALELKARVRVLTDLKKSIAEHLRMEAAWLQAQIQPHFFFNTLNSILILLENEPKRMKVMLEAFCYFLQTSFDFQNSEKVVPLDDELELVRSYLLIEKERFGNRLQVIWEIDRNVDIQLPPLSLQTLVENSINHGILKCASGGTLCIQICNHVEYTEIKIIDDGVGIEDLQLKELLKRKTQKRKGIGLFNTDQRLKQLYGRGLQIESKLNQGTTVSFQIPKSVDLNPHNLEIVKSQYN